jgi:1-deoxy-D-xylulose 5-phosphate reductoisomerase
VDAFLQEAIRWVDIPKVLEIMLERHDGTPATDADVVIDIDRRARREARQVVTAIAPGATSGSLPGPTIEPKEQP